MRTYELSRIFKNHYGFSLVELLVTVAITAIVALGSAYVLSSSQQTSNFSSLQSEIDRIHYLNLQLSRNPSFIMQQPGFEKGGLIYNCLQHAPPAGIDCTKVKAPASYVTPVSQSAPGLQKFISSSISFQLNCKMPQYCDSLSMTTMTSFKPDTKSATKMSFQNRRAVSTIPGYVLVPMTGFNFNCVLTQGLITKLNYGSSQAVCQPLMGTLSTTTEPLANFGPLAPGSTQTMTSQDCGANGFSSIGSFQDQTGCMVLGPVTTTTTLPSATTTTLGGGPTTTTTTTILSVVDKWNCYDGFSGPHCGGPDVVDAGAVSGSNPGSGWMQLTWNTANGDYSQRCMCGAGVKTVVSCTPGYVTYTCTGGSTTLPNCTYHQSGAGQDPTAFCTYSPSMLPHGGWSCHAGSNIFPCP